MRVFLLFILVIFFFSCQKDALNPYDDPSLDSPQSSDTNYFNNPSSFASLQNNIFQPYCNNSGCHDGTFEPDFRTIESSYSTLVYQPIIKNNSTETYQYRVKPGESDKSVLYARLLADASGISTFDNNSQSTNAVCFVLLELSILKRLQRASRLIWDPENLSLANSKVSITFFLSIFFLPIKESSLFKCDKSNSAL